VLLELLFELEEDEVPNTESINDVVPDVDVIPYNDDI
jgi:hypothetical protein